MSQSYLDELERAHPCLTMYKENTVTAEESQQQKQDNEEREQRLMDALDTFWVASADEMGFHSKYESDCMRIICRECGIDPKRIIGE